MPTMREIIAARRAAEKKGNAAPPKTAGRAAPVLSESNGTPEPSALTLAAERELMEPHLKMQAAGQAARMAARALGETEEDVPFVFHSPGDSAPAMAWKSAMLLPANRLGVWIAPGGEHAWLAVAAVESEALPGLLLIHRLPLLSRQRETEPF